MAVLHHVAVAAAALALTWSFFIYAVQAIGISTLIRYYSKPRDESISASLPLDDVPHITIIRPVKGLEPELRACLASTFQQTYPKSKLTIYLCVASEDDPAYPVLEEIVESYPDYDARVFIEEYDPVLSDVNSDGNTKRGPNPKIRNISRAYREAKGDIIWVIDCNVWISKGVAGRMVDRLWGLTPEGATGTKYKLVHQLPLVVDVADEDEDTSKRSTSSSWLSHLPGGGRLEEMFMATSHAKFYSAINTVGVAPCIVGKSTMFRKSHIEAYTDPAHNPTLSPSEADRGRGIDFFSNRICEDHLIGDLLWRAPIPGYANHGLAKGDLAIQPSAGMTIPSYWARRVRWLRVRKFTVILATLVEPGVESMICNFCLAYGLTTLPLVRNHLGIPQTWPMLTAIWLSACTIWMFIDRYVHWKLHECQSVETDENTPLFARSAGRSGGIKQRSFGEWSAAWVCRELLAFPIWVTAVFLGTEVVWRGQRFKVHRDMSVVAVDDKRPPNQNGHAEAKAEAEALSPSNSVNGLGNGKTLGTINVPKWEGPPSARQRIKSKVRSSEDK